MTNNNVSDCQSILKILLSFSLKVFVSLTFTTFDISLVFCILFYIVCNNPASAAKPNKTINSKVFGLGFCLGGQVLDDIAT